MTQSHVLKMSVASQPMVDALTGFIREESPNEMFCIGGPVGTAPMSNATAILDALGVNYRVFSAKAGFDNLIGTVDLAAGTKTGVTFTPGPMVEAMLSGSVVILDDADTLYDPRKVLPGIITKRAITVAATGETFLAQPGWRVICNRVPSGSKPSQGIWARAAADVMETEAAAAVDAIMQASSKRYSCAFHMAMTDFWKVVESRFQPGSRERLYAQSQYAYADGELSEETCRHGLDPDCCGLGCGEM